MRIAAKVSINSEWLKLIGQFLDFLVINFHLMAILRYEDCVFATEKSTMVRAAYQWKRNG